MCIELSAFVVTWVHSTMALSLQDQSASPVLKCVASAHPSRIPSSWIAHSLVTGLWMWNPLMFLRPIQWTDPMERKEIIPLRLNWNNGRFSGLPISHFVIRWTGLCSFCFVSVLHHTRFVTQDMLGPAGLCSYLDVGRLHGQIIDIQHRVHMNTGIGGLLVWAFGRNQRFGRGKCISTFSLYSTVSFFFSPFLGTSMIFMTYKNNRSLVRGASKMLNSPGLPITPRMSERCPLDISAVHFPQLSRSPDLPGLAVILLARLDTVP